MKTINLRIADLRKRKNVTQQEVADAVGVTNQTVSKWETESNMPDITVLPLLAEYFRVSVDQILGLVPLDGEEYIANESGTVAFWAERVEYLLRTRRNYWNRDYMEFLVKQVWKLDRPANVLDCGCGYGFLGLTLMPLLPKGSTYTGIDFTENLLKQGEELFKEQGIPAKFINQNVYEYQSPKRYDVVICQAVLRHLDEPRRFLQKMTELAKEGAYVICIDVNREFECDGLYIEGMDYAKLCRHDALESSWRTEYVHQGRDYAAAMKAAHMMQELGLQDVDVRMNDKVEFVSPKQVDYEWSKQDFIAANDWGEPLSEEKCEKVIQGFIAKGVSRKDAEAFCEREESIGKFFRTHPDAAYTFVRGTMITYGRKKTI